jgi:hypothetical protein
MLVPLERAGFIRRQPRVARSIELLVDPKYIDPLLVLLQRYQTERKAFDDAPATDRRTDDD